MGGVDGDIREEEEGVAGGVEDEGEAVIELLAYIFGTTISLNTPSDSIMNFYWDW